MLALFFTNSTTAGKTSNKLPVSCGISEGLNGFLRKKTDINENKCKFSSVHTLESVHDKKEKNTENAERLIVL